jgi:hypothetical protein
MKASLFGGGALASFEFALGLKEVCLEIVPGFVCCRYSSCIRAVSYITVNRASMTSLSVMVRPASAANSRQMETRSMREWNGSWASQGWLSWFLFSTIISALMMALAKRYSSIWRTWRWENPQWAHFMSLSSPFGTASWSCLRPEDSTVCHSVYIRLRSVYWLAIMRSALKRKKLLRQYHTRRRSLRIPWRTNQ